MAHRGSNTPPLPPFREVARLVPVFKSGTEYAFQHPARRFPNTDRVQTRSYSDVPIVIELPPVLDAPPEEDFDAEIDDPDPPQVVIEIPSLPREDPELCGCGSMREALGAFVDVTLEGPYIVPRLVLNETIMLRQALTQSALAAAGAWERIAFRRCPFDGTLMDRSLSWTPYVSDGQPFCCAWMAMMASVERVRLPTPDDPRPYARLVAETEDEIPFFHCPRCDAEIAALLTRRRRFFLG